MRRIFYLGAPLIVITAIVSGAVYTWGQGAQTIRQWLVWGSIYWATAGLFSGLWLALMPRKRKEGRYDS